MEHQTITSMGSTIRTVVVHELAHQWFGDEVTPRTWPHLWLNEGFATYAEYLYWQQRDADAPGTAAGILRSIMLQARRAEGTLVLTDTTNVDDMFSPTRVYSKGAAVLHMLRGIVGDTEFRNILRDYVAGIGYGTATTADFQSVAESVSGLDLDTFFDQWIRTGTGYPQYEVTSRLQRHDDYRVFVTLEQVQGAGDSNVDVFEMPVTIVVQTESGEESFLLVNDQRQQDYVLDVVGKPTAVEFDPDLWLLRDLNIDSNATPIATVPVFESVTPNPLNATSAIGVTVPDASGATVKLFDVAGRFLREVAQLQGSGPHVIAFDAAGLPSGVYFLRMESASGEAARKITVVR
jgi:aminopeptidase N